MTQQGLNEEAEKSTFTNTSFSESHNGQARANPIKRKHHFCDIIPSQHISASKI
jgi:hypothetical protein